MTVTANLIFTQGVAGSAGRYFVGVSDATVTVSNEVNTGVTNWKYELLDVPSSSRLTPATLSDGGTPTATFTPDVTGGAYRVKLTVTGPDNTSEFTGTFFVPTNFFSWLLPAYQTEAAEVVAPGSPPPPIGQGWMKMLNNMFLQVDASLGPFRLTGAGDPYQHLESDGTQWSTVDDLTLPAPSPEVPEGPNVRKVRFGSDGPGYTAGYVGVGDSFGNMGWADPDGSFSAFSDIAASVLPSGTEWQHLEHHGDGGWETTDDITLPAEVESGGRYINFGASGNDYLSPRLGSLAGKVGYRNADGDWTEFDDIGDTLPSGTIEGQVIGYYGGNWTARHNVRVGVYSDRSSVFTSPCNGDQYYATDSPSCHSIYDGSNWRPVISGVIGTYPPLASGFTANNSITITDNRGTLSISGTSSGTDGSSQHRSATIAHSSSTMYCETILNLTQDDVSSTVCSTSAGICFRLSSNAKACVFTIGPNDDGGNDGVEVISFKILVYNGDGTRSSITQAMHRWLATANNGVLAMRLRLASGDIYPEISDNLSTWRQVRTGTTFTVSSIFGGTTPDQVGLSVHPNGAQAAACVRHFKYGTL